MPAPHDPTKLPSGLPIPENDGAARHLTGMRLPDVSLSATDGRTVTLSELPRRTVIYIYPRTGEPGVPPPDGWEAIPGARGCTPQSCAFRDHFGALKAVGVDAVFGLSTQDTAYQREAVERLHLPFPILSDSAFALTKALDLPTFVAVGMTLLKRMTWVVEGAVIRKVFYPVFPPDKNAEEVLAWLRSR